MVSKLFHCQMPLAYFITLIVESSLGIVLLAYVLNQIPTRSNLRRWAFILFVLAAITPHLGLNYTYLRFASPLAVLLFATQKRHSWQCAALLAAGEAIELLISPELGGVLAIGAVVFALMRAWQSGLSWLLVCVAPLGVLLGFIDTVGKPYLRMVSSFAHGSLNLPVGPYPHVLILLVALVWITPFGLGTFYSWRDPAGVRLIASYATSLAFMHSALGRCDPIHIIFSGVGILALSLLCFYRLDYQKSSAAWLICLILLVIWSQYVNQRFFQMRTANVFALTIMPHLPSSIRVALIDFAAKKSAPLGHALSLQKEEAMDTILQKIASVTGSSCISTPLDITPEIENKLKTTHQYHPRFYAFWVDMMNPGGEQRSIYDVDQCPFMLLPNRLPENPHNVSDLAALQGFYLPYKLRNVPLYNPGTMFKRELDSHWRLVFSEGSYSLLAHAKTLRLPL